MAKDSVLAESLLYLWKAQQKKGGKRQYFWKLEDRSFIGPISMKYMSLKKGINRNAKGLNCYLL